MGENNPVYTIKGYGINPTFINHTLANLYSPKGFDLHPGKSVEIPLGVVIDMDQICVGVLMNAGTEHLNSIMCLTDVVHDDTEIICRLYNYGKHAITVREGELICKLVG